MSTTASRKTVLGAAEAGRGMSKASTNDSRSRSRLCLISLIVDALLRFEVFVAEVYVEPGRLSGNATLCAAVRLEDDVLLAASRSSSWRCCEDECLLDFVAEERCDDADMTDFAAGTGLIVEIDEKSLSASPMICPCCCCCWSCRVSA